MNQDIVLLIILSLPLLAIAGIRYYFYRQRYGKGAWLFVLVFAGVGARMYSQYQGLQAMKVEDPQGYRELSDSLLPSIAGNSTSSISIYDNQHGERIFAYYSCDGAAQLRELVRVGNGRWRATFATSAGDTPSNKLALFNEKEFKHPVPELRYVRTLRSWSGWVRAEDPASGQTLFSYDGSGTFQPIALQKQQTQWNEYQWQVWFARTAAAR